jgi:hypothetical protein
MNATFILLLFRIGRENYECINATFILLLFRIGRENYEMDCVKGCSPFV